MDSDQKHDGCDSMTEGTTRKIRFGQLELLVGGGFIHTDTVIAREAFIKQSNGPALLETCIRLRISRDSRCSAQEWGKQS